MARAATADRGWVVQMCSPRLGGPALSWLMAILLPFAIAVPSSASPAPPEPSPQQVTASATVAGQVLDSDGSAVSGARVTLVSPGEGKYVAEADAAGRFSLRVPHREHYLLRADTKDGRTGTVTLDADASRNSVRLLVHNRAAEPVAATSPLVSGQPLEFSDKPNFTVAGVTDWTAVGGHGADTTLRASEALAHGAATLPAAAQAEKTKQNELLAEEARLRAALAASPESLAANRALGAFYLRASRYSLALPPLKTASLRADAEPGDDYALAQACRGAGDPAEARRHVVQALARADRPEFHRLLGELDERLGDALASVHELQRAAQMDPSEQNYFAWGSELLEHRAIWEAVTVFDKGAQAHPRSSRLKAGAGAALFAGARYGAAAERLCAASDLAPENLEIYRLIGSAVVAAPAADPCVRTRLERFLQQQPRNADAPYFLAMLMEAEPVEQERAVALFRQAATLDPRYAMAYLQLGIIAFRNRQYAEAIDLYQQATSADPKLAEAHYRLGVAYDRTGQATAAKQEFALHEQLKKADADGVEQQRRQVKQFLVTAQAATAKP